MGTILLIIALSLSKQVQVLQKLEAKWVKATSLVGYLWQSTVYASSKGKKCTWGKPKGEVPLNSVCLFLINFELTVHTYSLEYAVDNLLCWMLMFFTPIDFISSGCSSVIQLLKICPRSQVHFQGAQVFFSSVVTSCC